VTDLYVERAILIDRVVPMAKVRPHAWRRSRVPILLRYLLLPLLVAWPAVRPLPALPSWAQLVQQSAQRSTSAQVVRAHLGRIDGNYPRLANYNGLASAADIPAYVHDALVIAPQWAGNGPVSLIRRLKQANPYALVLAYERTLQVDYPLIRQLYGVAEIYPGWWLLRAGSTLAGSIDARQTLIPVAKVGRFHRYEDALVDGESMHILAIRGSSLLVQRGFYSVAAAHRAGERIASHYSYRVDLRNTIITGRWENRRPWSFNLSSRCPRDPQGRTWSDFLIGHLTARVEHSPWDGVFFDNTDELLADPWVDVNNDNQPDGGVIGTRNVWHAGELALINRFHAAAPDALVMDNGTLDAGLASNGREMEGFPLDNGAYLPAMGDYLYWQRHDSQPALDLVNPDSGRSPRPDLGAMRFGLATALLSNGFYSYDEGWHKHGVVWNFDEYDNGAGSAVLTDVGKGDTYIRVRRTFQFRIGDIVQVGREQMQVRDLGSWNLIVQRGVGGTAVTTHPAGSVIATPVQIAEGAGYLGQPLGAAYPLNPPLHGPNLVANGNFVGGSRGWSLLINNRRGEHIRAAVLWTGAASTRHAGLADPVVMRSGLREERGYGVVVPWQALRKAGAVSLFQDGIAVRARTPYTLSFWARGTPGVPMPVLLSGFRAHAVTRYAPFTVTLHRGWYRYVLRYSSPSEVRRLRIGFQIGRTIGQTAVTGVSLQVGQSMLYARRFSHGLVLVNAMDNAQSIVLPRTYWHLRGDQDPGVNSGEAVRQLVLPSDAGLILRDSPPQ